MNIYPQEAEHVLSEHHAVADVAVFGVPNADFGEEVKAVVQLHDPAAASALLADEMIGFCRTRLSPIKCPRSVDFIERLPREDTGKLLKGTLRDRYAATTAGMDGRR